jgi:hypothetical protein
MLCQEKVVAGFQEVNDKITLSLVFFFFTLSSSISGSISSGIGGIRGCISRIDRIDRKSSSIKGGINSISITITNVMLPWISLSWIMIGVSK